MKACSYCGRENQDDAINCHECGIDFPRPAVNKPSAEAIVPMVAAGPFTDLSELDMGFEVVEGFSRPDWPAVRRFIKERVPRHDMPAAWEYVAAKWLEELASDLGGGSRVCRSQNFFCLSDLDTSTTQTILASAEKSLEIIRNCLGGAAWTGYYGKHVLLLFSDPDDYYSYISYFHDDGKHISSGGIFIRTGTGYAHIAIPCGGTQLVAPVLAHELTHNLLCHLAIPMWLNEGLAMKVARLSGYGGFMMDRDLAERHRAHWNENNIQGFWAGRLFDAPGDDSELSYDLGEILVNLLAETGGGLADFIKYADWLDGGQDAAVNWLGKDLGEVISIFLGSGNWRPQRKAIKEWLRRKPAQSESASAAR